MLLSNKTKTQTNKTWVLELTETTTENHIFFHVSNKLKKESFQEVWITNTLVLMEFHHTEERVKFLLLEKTMMQLSTIELEVVKLFLELVHLELVLISLESGSLIKMQRYSSQIQHGQLTEVSLKNQDGNGKTTDIIIENLEVLIVMVCLKI